MNRRRRQIIAVVSIAATYIAIIFVYVISPASMQQTVSGVPIGVIVHAAFIVGVFVTMLLHTLASGHDEGAP